MAGEILRVADSLSGRRRLAQPNQYGEDLGPVDGFADRRRNCRYARKRSFPSSTALYRMGSPPWRRCRSASTGAAQDKNDRTESILHDALSRWFVPLFHSQLTTLHSSVHPLHLHSYIAEIGQLLDAQLDNRADPMGFYRCDGLRGIAQRGPLRHYITFGI